jgi:hypothetical protein
MAGGTPHGVADALQPYAPLVNGVLFDPSGGFGQPFDTERARTFLAAITERGWNIALGVAGGLGPDTLHLVTPLLDLLDQFPDLNIDAQGKLRNEHNELDLQKVALYLERAQQLFS